MLICFGFLPTIKWFVQLYPTDDIMTQSTPSDINSKLVEYINEMLSVENAAIDRIQSRIEETPIQEAKARLQQHLEETRGQQSRLQEIAAKSCDGTYEKDHKGHSKICDRRYR
jgi:ferritin-like metal-binding protein YciE